MMEYTNQMMFFKELFNKKVQVDFQGGQITSDAGVLFLRETENRINLIKNIAQCYHNTRHPGYTKHTIEKLFSQRVFQIACGYEDANDSNELRKDGAFKISCEKSPNSEELLASQPTISRFENLPSRTNLYRIARAFVDHFIHSYTEPPEAILLDVDDTSDPTYGSQQLALFNAYYNYHCYQPMHIFEGNRGDLIATILRPGKRPKGEEIAMILARVFKYIKAAWPQTQISFRGDSHYSASEVHDLCDEFN